MSLNANELQLYILEALYKEACKAPGKNVIKAKLEQKISGHESNVPSLELNISLLKKSGYVEFTPVSEEEFNISITERGLGFIEGYNVSTSNSQQEGQHQPDVFCDAGYTNFGYNDYTDYANYAGASFGPGCNVGGKGNGIRQQVLSQQITQSFNDAYTQLKNLDVPINEREAIEAQLKELEEETLKEENASPQSMGTKLEWLKQHSVEIVGVVTPIVTSIIKVACGLPP
jgi:hypothetical protein